LRRPFEAARYFVEKLSMLRKEEDAEQVDVGARQGDGCRGSHHR